MHIYTRLWPRCKTSLPIGYRHTDKQLVIHSTMHTCHYEHQLIN